jgi:hypothetical protein
MGGRDMDRKTKITVLISSIFLIVICALSVLYHVNNIKVYEAKTGAYFCKINIIQEDNTKIYQWNIGIDRNSIKSGIVENETNGKTLEKFKDTVHGITEKRLQLFLAVVYLLYVIILFVSAQKDSYILANKRNKKYFQLFIVLLVIFILYKITDSFVTLSGLYQDINLYFNLIS